MAVKKTSKALIWTIASVLVVGAGVGLYFLLRKPKEEEKAEEEEESKTEDKSTSGGGQSAPKKAKVCVPTDDSMKKKETVAKFHRFLDTTKPLWYKDTDGKYKNLCIADPKNPTKINNNLCGSYGCQTDKFYKQTSIFQNFWAWKGDAVTNAQIVTDVAKNLVISNVIGDNAVVYEPTSSFIDENFDL
jgi:hypothetical protein